MALIPETNKEQEKAIIHGDGPQLIVAGAGTGKTKVITTRIAWLIMEKNINVDQILALTFTEKSAEEMQARVETMLPYGYVDLWISTFHSFCDKILKRHGLDIGLPNDFKLLDETETWLLVRKNLSRFDLDYYCPLGNPTKFIHALIKHFSRCKDEGIYPADYLRYAEEIRLNSDNAEFVKQLEIEDLPNEQQTELLKSEILRINEIANAYHIYQLILLENDCLDFADLINRTIELFRKRPLILEKYRRQFKYILVDEFQDTNFVQYELIKLLAAPKNNLTVVGDDDQSIYKFRGASIANIMQFKQDFPTAQEVVLNNNYRSRQEILDLAHKFIVQNNPNRLEEKLGINKKLKSQFSESAEIIHLHEDTVEDEAQTVLRKIVQLRNDNSSSWSDFAILVRANDSANLFINYLERVKVPYQFVALRGLYNKPASLDLINYLRLLDDYHESSAMFRILNCGFVGLEFERIIKLTHHAKKKSLSLYEILKQAAVVSGLTEEDVKKINKLLAQIESDALIAKNKKLSEVVLNFLYNSGYLNELKKNSEEKQKEELAVIQQIFKKIQNFENDSANATVKDFLQLVEMEMAAGDSGKLPFDAENGPETVKILTVHSAKGLEFDYVFVVNLVDRKFPTDERKETIEIPAALIKEKIPVGDFHLEEERRLFYVAITRAKRGLYFTSAENYGGARKKKLSRFLVELGFNPSTLRCDSGLGMTKQKQGQKSALPEETVEVKEVLKNSVREHYEKFSFSQLKTYEACPLRYKFAYVLKIPTFGNCHLTFGTTMHNSLQNFLSECLENENLNQSTLFETGVKKERAIQPLEKLIKVYDACWSDDWYENEKQRENYYQKGKEMLKKFHERFSAEQPKVQALEQEFNLKIGDYFFKGRIDRVDLLPNNKVRVTDYKTGKTAKTPLSFDDRKQLILYQIAGEELLKYDFENLFYYYLENDEQISALASTADKEKLKKQFVDQAEQICAGNFESTPEEHVCKYCDYKGICEFRKI